MVAACEVGGAPPAGTPGRAGRRCCRWAGCSGAAGGRRRRGQRTGGNLRDGPRQRRCLDGYRRRPRRWKRRRDTFVWSNARLRIFRAGPPQAPATTGPISLGGAQIHLIHHWCQECRHQSDPHGRTAGGSPRAVTRGGGGPGRRRTPRPLRELVPVRFILVAAPPRARLASAARIRVCGVARRQPAAERAACVAGRSDLATQARQFRPPVWPWRVHPLAAVAARAPRHRRAIGCDGGSRSHCKAPTLPTRGCAGRPTPGPRSASQLLPRGGGLQTVVVDGGDGALCHGLSATAFRLNARRRPTGCGWEQLPT